jgi:hypothetical protein
MDRFKEVIDEGNTQYPLWQEYNELRRTVPCLSVLKTHPPIRDPME